MPTLVKQVLDKIYSYRGVNLKSNIISPGGKGTNFFNGKFTSRYISQGVLSVGSSRTISDYFSTLEELDDFRVSELSQLVIESYKNLLLDYVKESESNLVLSNSDEISLEDVNKINDYLLSMNLTPEVIRCFDDFLYWNTYAWSLQWNSSDRKFRLYPLFKPYAVSLQIDKGSLRNYLIVDTQGNLRQVDPEAIFYMGDPVINLLDDVSDSSIPDESSICVDLEYRAASPLYYNIISKVKEYVLNERLLSLINIKDLVQPLLLMINCDKNTDITTANNLANNLENLINKYVDLSTIMTSKFSVEELMDAIINNIRVLPDFNGLGGGMSTLDLSKLKEKADSLRNEQETRKENIINVLSLTLDYVQGRSTKWDALRQSERLCSAVVTRIQTVERAICQLASNIYWLTTRKKVPSSSFKCNLFAESAAQLSKSSANLEITSSLINSTTSLVDSLQSFIGANQLVDSDKLFKFVKSKLNNVEGGLGEILDEDNYLNYLKENKER